MEVFFALERGFVKSAYLLGKHKLHKGEVIMAQRTKFKKGQLDIPTFIKTPGNGDLVKLAEGTGADADTIIVDVSNLSSDLSTKASSISTNASGVSTNAGAIVTANNNINTNSTAISGNDTDIATNVSAIANNANAISANTSSIVANDGDITDIRSALDIQDGAEHYGDGWGDLSGMTAALEARFVYADDKNLREILGQIQLAMAGALNRLDGDDQVSGSVDARIDADVATAVAGLIDSSPEALNTLNELAAALGDDEQFSTTITNLIGTKVAQSAYDTFVSQVNQAFTDAGTARGVIQADVDANETAARTAEAAVAEAAEKKVEYTLAHSLQVDALSSSRTQIALDMVQQKLDEMEDKLKAIANDSHRIKFNFKESDFTKNGNNDEWRVTLQTGMVARSMMFSYNGQDLAIHSDHIDPNLGESAQYGEVKLLKADDSLASLASESDVVVKLQLCFEPEGGSDFEAKGIMAAYKALEFSDMIVLPKSRAMYKELVPNGDLQLEGGPLGAGGSAATNPDGLPWEDADVLCTDVTGTSFTGDGMFEVGSSDSAREALMEWYGSKGFKRYCQIHFDGSVQGYIDTDPTLSGDSGKVRVRYGGESLLDTIMRAHVEDAKQSDGSGGFEPFQAVDGRTYSLCWSAVKGVS